MKTLFSCMIIILFSVLNVFGNTYYVSPTGLSLNPGTKDSPWSLDKANKSLLPGDTAILMNGIYTVTPIAPINSGSMGADITYRAESRHNAVFQDIVELPDSNGPVAVFVNDKSNISIDQCYFLNVLGWSNCLNILY